MRAARHVENFLVKLDAVHDPAVVTAERCRVECKDQLDKQLEIFTNGGFESRKSIIGSNGGSAEAWGALKRVTVPCSG